MPKAPSAPGFGRFEFRPGINSFPGWRGMYWDSDPATIPANQVVNAENVRIENGVFKSRGGQSKLGTTEISGANHAITGIHDDDHDRGFGGVMLYGAREGVSNAGPFAVHVLNKGTSTVTQALVTGTNDEFSDVQPLTAATAYQGVQGGFTLTNSGVGAASHYIQQSRNHLFFDSNGLLLSLAYYGRSYDGGGGTTDTTSRLYALAIKEDKLSVRPLVHFNIRINDLIVTQERVTLGTTDVVTDVIYMVSANKNPGELYRFDVVRGIATVSTALPASCYMLRSYNGQLVVLSGTAIGTVDATTGAYAAITMPAAEFATNNFTFGNAIIYRGLLHLLVTTSAGATPPYTSYVVTYDGTTTVTIRTAPGTVALGSQTGYHGACLAPDGKLYTTLMNLETALERLKIDVYDGTSWVTTEIWQNGAPASGALVTANSAYNAAGSVIGASINWDGSGFIIMPTLTTGTIALGSQSVFWTKGFSFSTLFKANYPADPIQTGEAFRPE